MVKSKKMQAYFDASLAGRPQYEEYYRKVISSLERAGCEVRQFVLEGTEKEKDGLSPAESRQMYRKILKVVSASDIVVTEMTFGSPAVSMVIQDAIHRYRKPVLMLYNETKDGRPGVPFTGNPSRLLTVRSYDDENLDEIISKFVGKARAKIPSSKFTVRLDEELDQYLEFLKATWGESSKNQTMLRVLQEKFEDDEDYRGLLRE